MKRYTFKVTCGCSDDLGMPYLDDFVKTVKAESLDDAMMELDSYCDINEIRAVDYDLISVKLERAAVLIGTV